MNKIGELIAELCPTGVEFRRVDDAVSVLRTSRGIKRENYSLGTLIPIVDQGQSLIAGYTDDQSITIPKGRYIVFGDHTCAVKWINFGFAPGADGTKVLQATDEFVPKYVYYVLANLDIPNRGYNRHWTVLRELRIPVPPLEIQREIVKVLDTFTTLTAELTAELTARRRQYQYYRDALLSFDEHIIDAGRQGSVRRMTLGEIGKFTRGRRFTKDDYVPDGISCIHYGDIYTQYGTSATKAVSHVRADLAPTLRFAKPGDIVIAAVGETVEDVGKAVAWLGAEEVAIHDDCFTFHHSMNPKFVSYYFQTQAFNAEKNKFVARAKVKRLSGENLAKLGIPVPPLEEQARIAAILDRFDALVNDLTSGLPAEIAARRQQYEHYRDRLLTFREAA